MLSTESCTASPRARPFGGGASQPATRAALCSILRWRGLLLRRPTRNSSGSRPDARASSSIISSPLISFGSTRRTARDASPHDSIRALRRALRTTARRGWRDPDKKRASRRTILAPWPSLPRRDRRRPHPPRQTRRHVVGHHRLRGGHEHVPSELRGRGCLERIAHFALLIASLPFFPRQGRRWR